MAVTCGLITLRPMCLASNIKTTPDQLRYQLHQLHTEAETTRANASGARVRFLRLSEAAEKLKRQAAISVHSGKENEARELLFQKKKFMQAMERSKSRIQLLDELSAKLNEAISIKESQLIGNVAFDLDEEDASGPVHIISPKQGVEDVFDEVKDSSDALKLMIGQDLLLSADGEASSTINKGTESLNDSVTNKDSIISGLKDISSYEEFLDHIDLQLNRIEAELITILNVSALVLNDKEKPQNLKVQQTIELLESIRAIRQRITGIMQKKAEMK